MPIFAALAAVLVLVLVFVIVKPFGKKGDVTASAPVVPVSNPATGTDPSSGDDGDDVFAGVEAAEVDPEEYDDISGQISTSGNVSGSLSEADMAVVSDLKINTNLPSEWLNILLLGTDERVLNDSARTDTMIICSINRTTGELKLASIMRDLAVELNDIGKYSGTYRINSANFFGGPNLAMRTVNENFGMNIQYYAMVNFFGFQRIAEKVGGIDIDITEDEMNQINKWAYNVYKSARKHNIDVTDVAWEKLETYGQNVHLNGTQTLGYARIRKLQGGDYMRTERQRTVLSKLLEKAKSLDAIQLASLANDLLKDIKTNLPLDDIFPVGMTVCTNGLSGVDSMHLPISGTYKEERRNNKDMLYDCDFKANSIALYNFIYE